jgi:molybdopterin/thiamine biosynthesis adenylyltransferase
MQDKELERYSRHILLPEIEFEGQEKLLQSHCLIVGAGGWDLRCHLFSSIWSW